MPRRIQVFHVLELNTIRLVLAQDAALMGRQLDTEIAPRTMVFDIFRPRSDLT
jgi:hypothetical protein